MHDPKRVELVEFAHTPLQAPQDSPVSTNKFYGNLFLGSQGQGVWTHPYSVTWSKGSGNAGSWGMAVVSYIFGAVLPYYCCFMGRSTCAGAGHF